MSRIQAKFTGNIVAEVQAKQVGARTVYEFPVYVNHSKKAKDSNTYVKTGDVSKIRVSVWGDDPGVSKGDLVEVTGNLVEREFTKRDGTVGRQLQTDWVESVVVKRRAEGGHQAAGFSVNPEPAPQYDESVPF